MNTFQLMDFMQFYNINKIFKGVFACDKLPVSFSLPAAFIVNLSPSSSEGSHWIAIYIDKFKQCEYFDSFGLKLNDDTIIKFMEKHGKRIHNSNIQLQHLSSIKCGKFAAVYAVFRMRNKTLSDFLQLFCKNLLINDKLIENFYNYLKK